MQRNFNIHPALLPKFGGKGMFGMNVHTAVITVMEDDTPEVLAERVLYREHEFLVDVISNIVDGKIQLG